MPNNERTYIMIKPDGVQRNLVGAIISRFEQRGFKIVALQMVTPSKEHLEKRTSSHRISRASVVTALLPKMHPTLKKHPQSLR